jgi:Holliday junction resolvase RusA-like endonuclease
MAEVIDLTSSDDDNDDEYHVFKIHFEVEGEPVPQPRPRKGKYGSALYDPASKKKKAFQHLVKNIIPATRHGPVFDKGVAVTVVLRSYQKRPNSDFRGGNRYLGMLKAMLPCCRPIRPDIDNLAKFVLDGLNGLVYHDDCQVVKLVVLKLLDSEGFCEGRTVVEVSQFDERVDM